MQTYPSTVEEKLGFDVLKARLSAFTLSRLGERRVANMRPSDQADWVVQELARVSELQEAFRFDDPVPLDHLYDLGDVLRRAGPEGAFIGPEDLRALQLFLSTLRHLKGYLAARKEKYPHLQEAASRMVPFPALEKAIAGAIDDEGQVRDDASPELRRIRRRLLLCQGQLREALQHALRQAISQGYATEEQPTIRNGRMVIPIRAEAKRKVQGFVQDTSATGQTVYIEPAASLDLNNEVRELEGEERREVERILRALTGEVRVHLDDLRQNQRALASFDLLQAKARLSNELDAVVPSFQGDGVIEIRQGRNPVLQLHFKRSKETEAPRTIIPLDLTLGDDYHTLVITGPNAGGKSVALKTVGLFALMLAYGLPIPAAPGSRFALFKRLIVDLGDEQSIEDDLSTFSSHVSNLRYMLDHADEGTLILIDEAGTGTDPEEGGALAEAVLGELTRLGARTIATTHHGSLKVFAHETEGVENGSMQFDQDTLSPTYRFQARVPGSSYAFEIAQRMGLSSSTLARARALVGAQKTALEDLIATFEARNMALGERLAEAEATLKSAKARQAAYEERLEDLRASRDNLREKAIREAEEIVQAANAQVERTIREIKEAQAGREATRTARAALETFKEHVTERKETVARRQQTRRKQARKTSVTKTEPAPSSATGPLQVGDQVVLDEGATAGDVLELDDREATIAVGSMRMRVRLDRLNKVGGPRKQQVTVRQVQQHASDLSSVHARVSVDLRGQRVDEALAEVTRFVDEGVAAGVDRLEILHGKGTGALRQAIHEYLNTRREVSSFEDAPWNQGGAGVTIVSLK